MSKEILKKIYSASCVYNKNVVVTSTFNFPATP